ncbi:hypothetical protein Pyn_06593 [Prunus yedoensis var. nudiflora]|uniref:Uncharacterized protein n=1 Tax=Prunus yedoensis var. nudiflora TaxID=2094558 RepID=A0A314YAQ5_PRUYE|nr:hypothetical protein Pyn_06593 [Prunus yedoensis var. nudiflora]
MSWTRIARLGGMIMSRPSSLRRSRKPYGCLGQRILGSPFSQKEQGKKGHGLELSPCIAACNCLSTLAKNATSSSTINHPAFMLGVSTSTNLNVKGQGRKRPMKEMTFAIKEGEVEDSEAVGTMVASGPRAPPLAKRLHITLSS